MVSNYLVPLGSVSVARGSLGQLVSRVFREIGDVGMMVSLTSTGWGSCGDGVSWEELMGDYGGFDGSFAKIHTKGMYNGDFGSSVFDGYVTMDVNGGGLQESVVMLMHEECWLMYIYGCCSITARQFAEMCTRGVHRGNETDIDGLTHIAWLLDEAVDTRMVYPVGEVASTAVVLDIYITDEVRTRGVHCNGSSFELDVGSVDVYHLDEDSLEGSESHLQAERTPAAFLEMSTDVAAVDGEAEIVAGCTDGLVCGGV